MYTLALNMIAGPGDARLLARCLDSFKATERFDEIVIALTSGDDSVKAVAESVNAKTVRVAWADEEYPHGCFARARNAALDQTESDYVMWLDCDDVNLSGNGADGIDKMIGLVQLVKSEDHAPVNAYIIPYNIEFNIDLTPTATFLTPRIFKRSAGIFRWIGAVHERMLEDWDILEEGTIAQVNNFAVSHAPEKPPFASVERNLRILRHEDAKGRLDDPSRYFFGRDLILANCLEEGEKIYSDMVDKMTAPYEALYSACITLALYKAYGGIKTRPALTDYKEENAASVERWARQALTFSSLYAEPYIVLGDTYYHLNRDQDSWRMYATALKKKISEGGYVKMTPYYEELPAIRMALLYEIWHEPERALWYNRLALNHNHFPTYVEQRKRLVKELWEDVSKN